MRRDSPVSNGGRGLKHGLTGAVAESNFETCYPKPQTQLCHSHRLRTAQFSEFVQDSCPDMQLIDLALEGT